MWARRTATHVSVLQVKYNYPVEACGFVMKVFFSCCVNRSLLKKSYLFHQPGQDRADVTTPTDEYFPALHHTRSVFFKNITPS